jgi:DNA-directed RNA polymerase subunit RPC12/RpoP
MSDGWRCPACGRGNAPWVATCQCYGQQATTAATTTGCLHNWVNDTAGTVCQKCGQRLPYTVVGSSLTRTSP